jgi:hypothetical protein
MVFAAAELMVSKKSSNMVRAGKTGSELNTVGNNNKSKW